MFIWAHRGASGDFPENTLLAFEQAIAQGADGIELDVVQVEDELYLWHDRYITEQSGKALLFREQNKQYIESLLLPDEQKIPTLSQALALISGRVSVNIELKHLEDVDLLSKVLLKACENWQFAPQQLLLSAFNHHLLDRAWQHTQRYPVGILIASSIKYLDFTAFSTQAFSLHFDMNCLVKADIERAQSAGYKCFVYTVDRETDIEICHRYGVDGIFTNFPQRSRRIVDELAK